MTGRLALTVALGALVTAGPASASVVDELCPQSSAGPNPSCVVEPIPGEGWVWAGAERPAATRLPLYRSLIPAPYAMPKDPMVAYTAVRLDAPGDPSAAEKDPAQGYMETTVTLRVSFNGQEGWFPLATPVNDDSQYDFGRAVGIPKYRDDVLIAHDHATDAWTGAAMVAAAPKTVYERVAWSPKPPPSTDPELLGAVRRLVLNEAPQFTLVRPWDETDPGRFPERVKFTVSPLVPAGQLPAPRLGTTTAYVNDAAGPASLPLWRDLVDAGRPRSMPGMFWHGSGVVYVSSQRLDGQVGPPGKTGTGPANGFAGPGRTRDGAPTASAPACRSRRTVRLRVRISHGDALRSARVVIDGGAARPVRGARTRLTVSLRGLAAGLHTVRVIARTREGRTVRLTRRYRACASA